MIRLAAITALVLSSQLSQAGPPIPPTLSEPTILKAGDSEVMIEKGADANPNAQASPFKGSFTMNINTTEKNGKSTKNSMTLYVRSYETALEMSQPGSKSAMPMRMILNSKTNDVITLMNEGGEKTGMKMKMPKVTVSGVTDDLNKDCVVKKTDETKQIEGYNCRKYIISYSDGASMETWITQDVDLNLGNLMNMMNSGMKGKGQGNTSKYPNMKGMGMEMTYKDTDGSISNTRISNLKIGEPEASKFSTDGYEIMDLSGMNLPMFGQ